MKQEYKTQFFEKPNPDVLPPGQEWIKEYNKNCKALIDYTKNLCQGTMRIITIYCLADLQVYLTENRIPYSFEAAEKWVQTNPKPGYISILQRLNDFFVHGRVMPDHALHPRRMIQKSLRKPWADLVDEYLCHNKPLNAAITYVRTSISRLLLKAQEKGLNDPSEITFDFLEEYLTEKALKGMSAGDVPRFLAYLESQNRCRYGLSLYLNLRSQYKPVLMSDFQDDKKQKIESLRAESLEFPAQEFEEALAGFTDCLEKHHYSTKGIIHHRMMRFLLFLAMHGLGYHSEIAQLWAEHLKDIGSPNWRKDFRMIHLFDTYVENGDIMPKENVSLVVKSQFDQLPEWCRLRIDEFINQQKRKGYHKSTIRMFYVSLTRFSLFLIDKNVASFSEITPDMLVEFSINDCHLSAEGKNAYFSRIRRFLCFLENAGNIHKGMSAALMCTAAPKETIVNILTDEEQKIALEPADTSSCIELRDKAMLSIGLLMGIRACDVVNIRLKDIEWNEKTIRFTQRKTGKEIIQPMPVKVGNSIYIYLKYGRNTNLAESDTLFIKNKPPYDSLTVNSCRLAVERVIPAREDGKKITFHDLRRTFATNRLREGCGASTVAELIGQSNKETLFKYLNLDEERTRLCPISLREAGLEMEET